MCGAVQHKKVWAAARAAARRGCGLLPPAPQLLGGEPALGETAPGRERRQQGSPLPAALEVLLLVCHGTGLPRC